MDRISKEARRAAKAAWRERKPGWAVCEVRIGAQLWVTLTPNPVALGNRIGFTLRQGSAPVAAMVAAYKEAGTVSVTPLETLKDDLSPLARERIGDERLTHWADTLGAARF